MSKKPDAPVDPRVKQLRDLVKRDKKGYFGKGNQNAAGRRTAHAEKMAIIRSTPANMTSKEMSDSLWLTFYVLAKGDLENGIMPVQWAAELISKKLWPDRHALVQDERMLKLEAELERIYREHPNLAPTLEERIGPMKIAAVCQ